MTRWEAKIRHDFELMPWSDDLKEFLVGYVMGTIDNLRTENERLRLELERELEENQKVLHVGWTG